MRLFVELVETRKVRSKEELRSLYRHFIKKYHPDSRPLADKQIDFDDLKRDFRAAMDRLDELAAEGPPRASKPDGFIYDAETYMEELRALVARGLPVSERAVRKNRAYAATIDYVRRSIEELYGTAYGFAEMNEQIKFIYRRIPRAYYYVLQVLWSAYDCASGYAYAKTIATRHLGCIGYMLEEMGFSGLHKFLGDVIEIASKVGAMSERHPTPNASFST